MNVRRLFDLSGRAALVTGASRGIGLQIAEALGEMGARLVIAARKPDELEAACQRLRSAGIDASSIAADLSKADETASLASQAIKRLGHVDILVNNAGTSWGAAAEAHPLDAWDKVMNVNARGVFVLTQAIGRESMIPRRYGRIVNVASIAGLFGNPPGTLATLAYNSSKGALVAFTRALATEWGKHDITVNALAPGFFRTRMTSAVIDRQGEDALAALAPLNRLGDECDLKGAAVLFASDAGKHITGQVLAVDGGATAY